VVAGADLGRRQGLPRDLELCHHGERAVTVAGGPDGELVAVLGSPFDPEAFVTWRAEGIQVFFRGEAPARLELQLSAGAFVTAVAYG
jgi:hypothetical protein